MVVSNKNPINKMDHAKNRKKSFFRFSEICASMFNHAISGSKAKKWIFVYMINHIFKKKTIINEIKLRKYFYYY